MTDKITLSSWEPCSDCKPWKGTCLNGILKTKRRWQVKDTGIKCLWIYSFWEDELNYQKEIREDKMMSKWEGGRSEGLGLRLSPGSSTGDTVG